MLDLLRDCANAPPVSESDNQGRLGDDKLNSDHYYQLAVDRLKKSNVWSKHESVRNWLNNTWLPLPQVCTYIVLSHYYLKVYVHTLVHGITMQRWARVYRDLTYHAGVDTNNGTEAQNKLLNIAIFPSVKGCHSLPSYPGISSRLHRKYLFENFKMTTDYRHYKSTISITDLGQLSSTA